MVQKSPSAIKTVSYEESYGEQVGKNWLNYLSSITHIQILQTNLCTLPMKTSWENLIKDQCISPFVIIQPIFTAFCLDYVLILFGENLCWSGLGVKGF